MKTRVKGIHHLTAVSGSAKENYEFYTKILGLRLVKKTVNFDDPSVYHLYYGDYTGSPGTLMTFFPYGGPRGRVGAGQVTSSAYPVRDLESWKSRLRESGVDVREEDWFGTPHLLFEDPHGMGLRFYQAETAPEELGPIGGAVLTLERASATRRMLEELGFEEETTSGNRTRMRLPDGGDFLDLVEGGPRGLSGPGTVHHIALRVAGDEDQAHWLELLTERGYRVSPVMDRNYFHSIYFRSPGGVLFELATDPPGMLIDETLEELGQKLLLPPQYEPHRTEIERRLEPLEEVSVKANKAE